MDKRQIFGLRLQSLRKARGLSQEQLAEHIDRSKDAISKMERGINLPALDTVLCLAGYLGVSVSELVGELDEEGLSVGTAELRTRLVAASHAMDAAMLAALVDHAEALMRLAPIINKGRGRK